MIPKYFSIRHIFYLLSFFIYSLKNKDLIKSRERNGLLKILESFAEWLCAQSFSLWLSYRNGVLCVTADNFWGIFSKHKKSCPCTWTQSSEHLKGENFVAKHETSEVAQVNNRDLSVVRNISQWYFKGLPKVFCSSVVSSSWHQCNRHSLWCSDFSGPVRAGNSIEIYVCINSC